MLKRLAFSLLAAIVLLSAATAVFAATDIVDIAPEAGIREKFVTNSTDTRMLEIKVAFDDSDGFYSVYSNVESYYPEGEMLWLTLAENVSVKASEHKNLVAEILFNVWNDATGRMPDSETFKVYVSTDGGITYTEKSAAVTVGKTDKMLYVNADGGPVYKATTDNLLALVGSGDTVTNVKFAPHGGMERGSGDPGGAFRLVGFKLIADTDIPPVTEASAATPVTTAAVTTSQVTTAAVTTAAATTVAATTKAVTTKAATTASQTTKAATTAASTSAAATSTAATSAAVKGPEKGVNVGLIIIIALIVIVVICAVALVIKKRKGK